MREIKKPRFGAGGSQTAVKASRGSNAANRGIVRRLFSVSTNDGDTLPLLTSSWVKRYAEMLIMKHARPGIFNNSLQIAGMFAIILGATRA